MYSSILFLRSFENIMNVRLYGNLSYLSKCQNVYILLLCQIVGVLGASETNTNEKTKPSQKSMKCQIVYWAVLKKNNFKSICTSADYKLISLTELKSLSIKYCRSYEFPVHMKQTLYTNEDNFLILGLYWSSIETLFWDFR